MELLIFILMRTVSRWTGGDDFAIIWAINR